MAKTQLDTKNLEQVKDFNFYQLGITNNSSPDQA
jgi:hypothetical protein